MEALEGNKKEEITLCIGIFFDGTGNNANNFNLEKSKSQKSNARAITKKPFLNNISQSEVLCSYTNYLTNIYLLQQMYLTGSSFSQKHSQISIYIEGVGTSNSEKDNMFSMSTGLGENGIIGKVYKAISLISLKTKSFLQGQLESDVIYSREIYFDVFGFSRGAAAARHLANMIFDNDHTICTALKNGLTGARFSGEIYAKTRFLGLFDTVCSVAVPHNGFNPNSGSWGGIKLDLRPRIADKVFHIAALNECRFNFPLASVKPNWSEIFLPGTHSDIGGGYYPIETENLFLTRPIFETVPISTPDDKTSVFRKTYESLKVLHSFPALSPLLKNERVYIKTWNDPRMPTDRYGMLQKRSGAAVVIERTVFNNWSNVALRIMLDAAQDAGVMFDYKNGYSLDDETKNGLKELCEKAIRIGRAVRNGGCLEHFSITELHELAYKYIHCSANWNRVLKDEHGQIKGAVKLAKIIGFINRPDENWSRTIYDMNGKRIDYSSENLQFGVLPVN